MYRISMMHSIEYTLKSSAILQITTNNNFNPKGFESICLWNRTPSTKELGTHGYIGDQLIGADEQAAHSANTAEAFYGRTNLDIPLLTNSAFERFFAISITFHKLRGYEETFKTTRSRV
jgi:hypothetical protein